MATMTPSPLIKMVKPRGNPFQPLLPGRRVLSKSRPDQKPVSVKKTDPTRSSTVFISVARADEKQADQASECGEGGHVSYPAGRFDRRVLRVRPDSLLSRPAGHERNVLGGIARQPTRPQDRRGRTNASTDEADGQEHCA